MYAMSGDLEVAQDNVDAVLGPCPVSLADDGQTSYLRGYVVDSTGGRGVEKAVSQVVQMGSAAEAEAALRTAADGVRACWGPTAVLVRADARDEAVVLHGTSADGSGSSAQALVMVRLGSDLALFAVSLEDRDVLPYLDALATSLPTQLETVLVLSGGQAWVTSPAELQGEWAPVVLRGDDVTRLEDMSGRPVLVTFTADEEWWGSDGCNRTWGPLAAGPQGGFTATPEGTTLVGCPDRVLNANVEVVTEASAPGSTAARVRRGAWSCSTRTTWCSVSTRRPGREGRLTAVYSPQGTLDAGGGGVNQTAVSGGSTRGSSTGPLLRTASPSAGSAAGLEPKLTAQVRAGVPSTRSRARTTRRGSPASTQRSCSPKPPSS